MEVLDQFRIWVSANTVALLLLLVLITIVGFTWLHYEQARRGHGFVRRPLRVFDALRGALGRGAETGQVIHASPGAGTIGNRVTTAETVVGLLATERVVTEAARNGAPVLVSSGDAVAYLALRGTLRQAYWNAGQPEDYRSRQIELLAHQDSAAYSAGVAALYARQPIEASQLIGAFEQEFLLPGEEGAQRRIPQVAGATSTAALPVMLLSTPDTLIGEEVFAAEAYLSADPTADARLRTQDALRIVVIWLLIGGFLYSLIVPVLQPFIPFPLPSLSAL